MADPNTILAPGRNCERIVRAARVAWLIDAERYYAALADALERAERSVFVLGWDLHSQVRLRRDGSGADEGFVELLERVVRRRRALRIRLLCWDYALIYALERELLPRDRFQRRTHRRIQFRLDGRHPPGSSHHQKLVVIDDAIAFCGGIDITACRWDTRDHAAGDPRRSDPGFAGYGPFHDVQVLVDGEAARAVGEVTRERWRHAGGRRLRASQPRGDPWPEGVEPDVRDVGVGIALTRPEHDGRPGVRQVEALYLDAIAAARRSIYLENQYLTSEAVVAALEQRLARADAPEVVIVLPGTLSGWLEKRTMGALMERMVRRLRAADASGRLGVYVPVIPGPDALQIHAKLMVVDDRLARIGSANLSNRSMGADSECDLAVESTPARDVGREIEALRDTLLAEHLGAQASDVREAVQRHGSLLGGIESLCHRERRLARYASDPDPIDEDLLLGRGMFDPEQPIRLEALRDQIVGDAREIVRAPRGNGTTVRILAAMAIPIGLLALWQLTPLAGQLSPESLADLARALESGIGGRLLALLVFVVAAVVMVPVVSLIVAAAVIFGFWEGALIAWLGSVASAALGYAVGGVLWRDAVQRIAGPRLDRLSRSLSRRGVLATAIVRVVPVAPFAVVNLVAGASHIRLRDFMLGTALAMAPGTAALAFFGERAAAVLRSPTPGTIAAAAAGIALTVGVAAAAQRVLARRVEGDGDRA